MRAGMPGRGSYSGDPTTVLRRTLERCRDSFSVSGRAGHARWQEGDLWAREMTVGILSRVRNDDLRPGNVGSVVGRLAG
jgi:hypothetical protein